MTKATSGKSRLPNNRESLLTAAARHFALQGISGTNLKSIASEVGVSAPAIYYHFESKEQLAFEAFHWAMSEFNEYVRARTASTDPTLRMAESVRAHVQFKLQRPEIAMAYSVLMGTSDRLQDFNAEYRGSLKSLEREYYNFLHRTVDAGLAAGQFHAAVPSLPVFAIISMCEHVPTWFSPAGPLSIEEVSKNFADYALGILKATPEDRLRAADWLAVLTRESGGRA
ncbi:TetR/AcrR family transcriptional regulator [Arthrobacter sp. ISL-69]|uniref:TetR/AcrR family transcriptional regulator n=1 Tax=Arthrobacter sp. ISL-69 TaxID=2819113 RepID=UPI001BE7D6C8|nr:TetR/AcrR family transcriptional regulator [Arthrobacter sp. ISL-69]MBT2539028.1 TetR family transcriptional regulator [Arthrobacter sp. ISL-69]